MENSNRKSPDPSATPPVFLTLPKTARRLGVSTPIARGMARDGSLPIIKVGRRRLVVASLLNDAWFLQLARDSGSPGGPAANVSRGLHLGPEASLRAASLTGAEVRP
jgi:excisionase family DNA binding protein